MKLYLARHGQTDWNLGHRVQGQTDIPLNATGISQAEALREKLKDYDFDVCYCSPLKRAVQTAEIAVGNRVKIIFDDNLKERNYGSFEGADNRNWDKKNDLDRRANINDGGIEPIKDLLARSKKVLDRLKAENPPDAKILVVGHGTLLKTLHFNIIGYDDDTDFLSFNLKNGDVVEHEI